MRPRPSGGHYFEVCPLCESPDLQYLFVKNGFRVVQCGGCRVVLLSPQPSDEALAQTYSEDYFLGGKSPDQRALVSKMKRATARLYLDHIDSYRKAAGKQLLDVGCGRGDLLVEAQARGYEVTGVDISAHATDIAQGRVGVNRVHCGEIEEVDLPAQSLDICVLSDLIQQSRDPVSLLETIHHLLKPGGVLFIAAPSLDSWSAHLLRQNWMEFKAEHLFYFDRQTIQHLLFRTGYHEMVIRPGKKVLTQDYIYHHFERFPVPGLTFLMRRIHYLTPPALRRQNVAVDPGSMVVMARARELSQQRKLSVIVPAYNEKATFRELMEPLVQKEIDGLDMEIVVVESNSTDGTREEVLRYRDHPRVKIILEGKPQGKGHAVRAAFGHITGDFVLVQDADLEYDLNDYEALLEPLRNYREAFVLGSRHQGGNSLKIREFEGQPFLSTFMNLGHVLFTTSLNLLYGQHLGDPFTMYKVFRRDCLYGLSFECDRFDFDYELVIKLIRKGYRPVEIPVNYRSRSFAEGKKVSMFLDPLTWIRALIKYRFVPIEME